MDNLIGKRLDGLYEVQELIGSGGMANVYKAVMRGRTALCPPGLLWPLRCCGRSICTTRILCAALKTNPRPSRC